MTAAGDAWLSEMWKLCRELSRAERMAQREADAVARMRAEELCGWPVDNLAESPEMGAA